MFSINACSLATALLMLSLFCWMVDISSVSVRSSSSLVSLIHEISRLVLSHAQWCQTLLCFFFCCFKHTALFFHVRIRLSDGGMILQPDLIQSICERFQCVFTFCWFQFTLPYRNTVPTHLRQSLLFFYISLLVPANLRHPEIMVCAWYPATGRTFHCS